MKKAVIIGAGPAGITAGYELQKQSKEYEVTILEATDQIGGLSRTICHNGNRMDIGPHRFFSKDARVLQWWQEILPLQGKGALDDNLLGRRIALAQGGPDPETEDAVMLLRKRVSRIYYQKKFFDYPVKLNRDTIRNMGMRTALEAGCSYLAACGKREEHSLEDFYIHRFGRKLYQMFFEAYTQKVWGRHPRDISADWGAQRVKGLSVAAICKDIFCKSVPGEKQKRAKETSLIGEFWYPKYGSGQLWETAAQRYQNMGGRLLRNTKVTGVRTDGGRIVSVQAQIRRAGETQQVEFPADILLSSMPLKDLVGALNDAPADVKAVADALPYRDLVTIGILADQLNLKNETDLRTLSDMIPDCWIYVQDAGIRMGRIPIFNNFSPYLVKEPQKTVWIGLEYFCTENDAYWRKTEEEWIALATEELTAMGVIQSPRNVLDAHCEKVKKAYPAYFDAYYQIETVIRYLNRFPNLYCIGRNGQHRYNNMDHSMETAFAAVKSILENGAEKEAVWRVNTEAEYHESKKGGARSDETG